MTQDNDTGHFYPTPPCKSYNPFDSDDDTLDSPAFKSDNVYKKEDCIGFDLKAFEKSADALTFDMDDGDFLWEEAILGQSAVNASANGHTGPFEKDGQLYTDKNVTECELPEFINCHNESTYQSVKDIGIDEGVPTHDEIWPSEDPSVDGQYLAHESRDDDSLKITERKLNLEARASSPADWASEAVETAPRGLVYDVVGTQAAAETDPNKDASKHGEPDFTGKDGADHDDSVEKKGNINSVDKLDNVVVQEPTTGETPSKLSTDHGEDKVRTDESRNEEETLPDSSKHVAVQESAYSSVSNKMTHNSNLESGSITLDFNSSTNSDPRKQGDDPQNAEIATPPTTQTMTKHEEGTSSNSVVATPEPRVHGETSFSTGAPVPLPSSITFSGPVAYSGSISLRSESSAGSTRSFAFPILQTEGNSSPVRMAKADQRHLRKHRGWVQAIVCCRF